MQIRMRSSVLNATVGAVLAVSVAGCNKPQEVTGTPAPKTTVGTEIDDTVVTARVKAALLADAAVKSYGFKVDTSKGEVQLSGFVDTMAQKNRAGEIARNVQGVQFVTNNLIVK